MFGSSLEERPELEELQLYCAPIIDMSSSDYEGCSLFPCLSSPKKKRRNASPSTSSTSLDQSSEAIRLSKNQLQASLINSQEHELENTKTREQLAIDKWEQILQQEKLEKRRPSTNNSPGTTPLFTFLLLQLQDAPL